MKPAAPLILHAMLAQQTLHPTHKDVAEVAGVGERTVAKLVSDMKPGRFVIGGRPPRLGPGLGLVLGISLGSEHLRAAIVDAAGELHHEAEEPLLENQLDLTPDELLARMRRLARSVLAGALDDEALWASDARSLAMLGVAIAWPSAIDRQARPGGRTLRHALWMQQERFGDGAVPLTVRTARAFGAPFSVERCHALNDANADALTVAFDQAMCRAADPDDNQWRVALVLRVAGRLCAATIALGPHRRSRLSFVDATLISGTSGFAGELGHLPIPRKLVERLNAGTFEDLAPLAPTAKCSCGRELHLEAIASAPALADRLHRSGYEIPSDGLERSELIRAGLEGELEPRQVHALRDIGRAIGSALASPILMLDPHSVTLTGSLATEQVREGVLLERNAWNHAIGDNVAIRVLGGESPAFSGVRGAALAVIRRSVYRGWIDRETWTLPPVSFGDAELDALAALDAAPAAV